MIVLHFDDISEELQWPTREVQCMRRCRKTFAHNLLLQWEAFNGVMGSSGHLQPLKKGTNTHTDRHTHLAVFVLFCLVFVLFCFVLSYATNMSLFCKLHFLFVKSWIPNFDWWKTDMEVCKRKMWMVWKFSQKGVVRMNWHKFFPGF